MYILGIDTSFDDTAAAVLQDTTILANAIASDLSIYKEWGGVVPRIAREAHEAHIDAVINTALKRAKLTFKDIDAIAVTLGPGLSITLEIGIAKTKELAKQFDIPVIAINHMEGHLLSFLCQPQTKDMAPSVPPNLAAIFPAIGILVSGKNTQFVLTKAIGEYQILGETQDDAIGEAFDKVGRMLGLGYPAGSLIEKLSRDGVPGKIVFPIPMHSVKSSDTSYSGLKTAAMRIIEPLKLKRGGSLTKQDICDVALGFQTASLTHLLEKLNFAIDQNPPKSLILGGGVAANLALRQKLRQIAKANQIPLYLPYTKRLCIDNAAMIALVGFFKATKGQYVEDLELLDRKPNLRLG